MATGDTITVGCKLPHGIHMDFNAPGEPLKRITLKGINANHTPGGPSLPAGAIGLTHGVPKDLFEKWMADHKDLAAVKNGLIFAHAQPASVQSIAKERSKVKTGLEPLDQDKLGKDVEKLSKD